MDLLRVYEPRPVERVVVLGMGLSIINWFNDLYNDPLLRKKCEVWTVNWGAVSYEHDLSFNCHSFNDPAYKANAKLVYQDYKKPLITLFAQEDMPNTYSFPLGQVLEELNCTYLMNGVAFITAYLALCQKKFGTLKLVRYYGCDYNYRVEGIRNQYEDGRACVEWWMGILHSMGVNVGCAETSQLIDTCHRIQHGMYGYGTEQPDIGVEELPGDRERVWLKGFTPRVDMERMEASIEEAQKNGHDGRAENPNLPGTQSGNGADHSSSERGEANGAVVGAQLSVPVHAQVRNVPNSAGGDNPPGVPAAW